MILGGCLYARAKNSKSYELPKYVNKAENKQYSDIYNNTVIQKKSVFLIVYTVLDTVSSSGYSKLKRILHFS